MAPRRHHAIIEAMQTHTIIRSGAVLAGLAVVFGAFGAHALADRLEGRPGELFDLATRYQMYHGLALLGAGAGAALGLRARAAAWCWLLGAGC